MNAQVETATAARRRVEDGLDTLRAGLAPWVEKRMRDRHGENRPWDMSRAAQDGSAGPLDVRELLKVLLDNWNDLSRRDERLRKARSFVSLALDACDAATRFTGALEAREALRYLDAMRELLAAVGAAGHENALAALYDEQRMADDEPGAFGLAFRERNAALSGKYSPLYRHLCARTETEWRVSLAGIEAILGFRLPESARLYRAWWANREKSGVRSHAIAWQAAGWRTSAVDLEAETLMFRRAEDTPASVEAPPPGRKFDVDAFWPPIRGGSWPPGFLATREQIYDEFGRLTGGPQNDPDDGR